VHSRVGAQPAAAALTCGQARVFLRKTHGLRFAQTRLRLAPGFALCTDRKPFSAIWLLTARRIQSIMDTSPKDQEEQ